MQGEITGTVGKLIAGREVALHPGNGSASD